jgi:hypothetical protein
MSDFSARRRQVPFLVLAPSLVVVVGVLAAFLMAALGTRELRIQSDQAAALRAKLLAIARSTAGILRVVDHLQTTPAAAPGRPFSSDTRTTLLP